MSGDSRLSARFGSDTSDLKSGLAEINRELKVVNSSFQASASVLGDWSSTSDGLNLRISTLNKSIDLQKEKVNALQVAYERQVQAHGAGSAAAQNAEIALNKESATLGKLQTELKDTTQSLNNLGKETKETGNDAKESESKWKSLGDVVKSFRDIIKNVTVVAAGVGVAIKKALDFGAEGAKIAQLSESFNNLMQRFGAAPDILERLMEATRNTVDDEDLMAATMKMLTGTSDELGKALLDNAPMFLEIAKASNKLNPMLGSTIDLYGALGNSIKNLTPRGLKEIGIVVDTTNAYEEYAKSVGKTATALTEEEQSMALLNVALEKGQGIIDQVGGNTESATDRFDRANVAIGDLKDTIELGLLPILGDMADGLNLVLGGKQDTSAVTTAWANFFNTMISQGKSAAEIIDAYNQKTIAAKQAFDDVQVGFERMARNIIKLTQDESKFLTDQEGLQQALLITAQSADEYAMAILGIKNALDLTSVNFLTQILVDYARAQYNAAHAADAEAQAEEKAADATDQQQEAASKAKKDTIDLANSYNTLASAAQKYGLSANDLADIQDTLTLFVNGLDEQLNTTASDMELMAEATTLGIVGATDYANAMYAAANGIQVMSDAERESLEASVASEQAKRNQALAVQAASQSYLELASSLKGATSAQIAETAIQGLGELQKAGKIDFSSYFVAVSDIQESFGLSDEKSRALAGAIPLLNDALATGKIPAYDYADALDAIVKDAADGVINMDAIITSFGSVLEPVALATEAVGTFDEKMTAVPESAAVSAQNVVDTWNNTDWVGTGVGIDVNLAKGITQGTSVISAAVKDAIQAAIDAANARGVPGPTTNITPTRPGYASGGYGKVPPGYPDDSYPIWLTSGEEFLISAAGSLARAQQDMAQASASASMSGAAPAQQLNATFTGDIIIQPLPGMDEEVLANKVVDKLGDTLSVARSKGLR